jgi:AcrR family transcriptional regulator
MDETLTLHNHVMLVKRLERLLHMTASKEKLPKKPDGRLENAALTRAALRAAGRKLFGTLGYDASGVGALCAEAKVTSGALYHHFGDKKGLFAAVAEELDSSLVLLAAAASAKASARGAGAWDAFLAGIDALLGAGVDPLGRRIGLTDAPAVLGADGWIAIRERHGLGAMMGAVQALQHGGELAAGDPRRLARLILALVYGAIEALPDDPASSGAALAESTRLLHTMLAALRRA